MSWPKEEKGLQIWGCAVALRAAGGKQVRAIVAAKSRVAAARALGITDGHLKMYGSEAGNAVEIAIAGSAPGKVFYSPTGVHGVPGNYVGVDVDVPTMESVMFRANHAAQVQAAQQAGQAVWMSYTHGSGARLALRGGIVDAHVQYSPDGYKVTVNEVVLKERVLQYDDAKRKAVLLAHKLLTDALNSIPTDVLLER